MTKSSFSNQYDPEGIHKIVLDKHGNMIRGHITKEVSAAVGLPVGPIVLLHGLEKDGTGFGKAHLDAKSTRGLRMKALGFNGVSHFVSEICSKYEEVRRAKKGRLALSMSVSGVALIAYLEYKKFPNMPGMWSVVTAVPTRRNRDEPLWKRVQNEKK